MATAELNDLARFRPLDPERFEITHDVPIFDEHETEEPVIDDNGQVTGTRKVKYTRAVLEAIAENMNRRIRDTGDYTVICFGHTPTPSERQKGREMPDTAGLCGPYYVGTIGEENPRACIIAQNWAIYRDEVERARKNPRRSVEVWREDNLRDRTIEPIALLGAETPRRDLGLAYSRRGTGKQVWRYTAMAPSATNTFVPGADDDKRRNANPELSQEADMALADEDIQKLVAAVMELAPMKWAAAQMEKEQTKAPEMSGVSQLADPELEVEPAEEVPPGSAEPEATPKERNMDPEKDDPDKDQDKDQYRKERKAERERYAAMEQHNRKLTQQFNEMATRVKEIEDRERRTTRYSRIDALDGQVVFDREEEYARVNGMTDEQFDAHLELMQTRYEKNPIGMPSLPRAVFQGKVPDKKDSKDRNARILKLADVYANQGIAKSFDELGAEVDAQRNGAAV